jgi:uncharacterized membrane protein
MRTTGTIKMLIHAMILFALLNYATIQAGANPGAGIDFVDPDPTIYTVTFYSNDERIDTTLAQVQVADGNVIGAAGIPHNPTRLGFSFVRWNTMPGGTGSNVTAATVVTSNLSVFAQWTTPTPTPTPTPTAPPALPTPALPAPPGQTLPALPPLDAQPPEISTLQPPLAQEQQDQESTDLEEIDIFEQEVPQAPLAIYESAPPLASINGIPLLLFALPGISSWALLNLVMSIAGIILVVITIMRLLTYKRKEDKKVHDRINSSFNEEFENPESNDSSKKIKLTWFTAGAVAALTAVVVFILTQDITAIIALADWWTIVHIAILTVVVVSCVIVYRGQKSTKENGSDKDNTTHNQA